MQIIYLPAAPALKYSQTVFAHISASPNPVSASQMTGNPDEKCTSFIVLQKPSKVTSLHLFKLIKKRFHFGLPDIWLTAHHTDGRARNITTFETFLE